MADIALADSSIPQHIADPIPEEADFLLRSELSPEQGVFFGDLITLKAPFSANTYHWKKDGKVLDCHNPDLTIKSFTPDDIGEYSVEDDLHQSSATIVLVRHKAPIKYCLHCGKRNHAHSKKCNTCGEGLPCKEKPAKRKHESLSMKHYEDTILEKISEMKENFGDDVDVLLVVSRTHYSRTLCTVKGTDGAAQHFLAAQAYTPMGTKNMQSMIQDAWSLGLDQYYNAKGGRMGKKSGKWKKTKLGLDASVEQQHDDGAVQALFRALAPYQPPGGASTSQVHPGYAQIPQQVQQQQQQRMPGQIQGLGLGLSQGYGQPGLQLAQQQQYIPQQYAPQQAVSVPPILRQ